MSLRRSGHCFVCWRRAHLTLKKTQTSASPPWSVVTKESQSVSRAQRKARKWERGAAWPLRAHKFGFVLWILFQLRFPAHGQLQLLADHLNLPLQLWELCITEFRAPLLWSLRFPLVVSEAGSSLLGGRGMSWWIWMPSWFGPPSSLKMYFRWLSWLRLEVFHTVRWSGPHTDLGNQETL